jgi:general secretion pathway protein A
VYRIAHGIPRIINVVCHRALLIGYTREERHIDRATIRQAAKELGRDGDANSRKFLRLSFSPLLTGLLIFLSTAVLVFASTQGWLSTKTRPASPDSLAALVPPSPPLEGSKEKHNEPIPHVEQTVEPTLQPPSVTEKPDEQGQSPSPYLAPPTSTQGTLPSEQLPTLSVAAVSQEPNQEASERQIFLQPLRQMTVVDSAVRATNGLLQIWGINTLQNTEWQGGALDLSAIARTRHLEYLPVNGAFTLLSLLDLPAILELTTPDRHELRFALLLGITGDRCRILLDREQEVPLKILNEHWFGKAHLFWKDFENVGAPLAVGSVGQQVRRLYMLLSQAPGINARLSPEVRLDTFSRQTEEIVARFQKSRRLAPDGVVGPQTMIALYNTVAGYTRPSLKTANSVAQASRESTRQGEEQFLPNASEDRRRKVHEHNS